MPGERNFEERQYGNVTVADYSDPVFMQRRGPRNDDLPHQSTDITKSDMQMPLLDRKRQITTVNGVRRYLIREHGFVFVPKNRTVVVPEKEAEDHNVYNRYLRKATFLDPFGEDHERRKNWQREQAEFVDPGLLTRVLINDCQFTGNAISAVLGYTQFLAFRTYARFPQLASSLADTKLQLHQAYEGPKASLEELEPIVEMLRLSPLESIIHSDNLYTLAQNEYARERYRKLPYNEKLEIVHKFCDIIAGALWQIADHTNPEPRSVALRVTGNLRKK